MKLTDDTYSHDSVRVTDAIAKNVGIRWCSSCQMDKPAAGFVKQGYRWRCAACQANARQARGART